MTKSASLAKLFEGKIGRFDVCAFLKVLEKEGFPLEQLRFQSNNALSSTTGLCESFSLSSSNVLALKLNFGLLMGDSPLPSYFRKCMEKDEIDEDYFTSFLQFFNHCLVKTFFEVTWIERFLPLDWKEIKLNHLLMLGLDSVSSIHWIFSLCFPELKLSVEKSIKEQKLHNPDFVLGLSKMGEKSALGGYLGYIRRAFSISLTSEVEQTDTRVFWPTEIRNRLKEFIFPLIRKTHIYFIVTFTMNQYKRATYLNQQSTVGFTSLGEGSSNFTWLLFEGDGISSSYCSDRI